MPSDTDEGSSTVSISLASVSTLGGYLARMVPALLEEEQPNALLKLLEEQATKKKLKKFITDPQTKTLLIQRYLLKKKEEDDTADKSNQLDKQVVYSIVDEVVFGNPQITSIVLIKKSSHIEANKSIYNQMFEMILNDSNPYGTLHSYISAVAPHFKSYFKENQRTERDKIASSVEEKIAELETALLLIQQNTEIPEITLQIHPVVLDVMKKCQEKKDRKATVADFEDKLDDSSFLNELQAGVNRWIREIQKVTKLDHDPSSGTALQEISFWLNLDRALSRIQEKRDSPEVALTLDILKRGRRFHATVSFDADTRLKEAIATVSDFNPLVKDFPINDLLSAIELDKIRIALQSIFQHLKKIRNTNYPIRRALKLMESISRDLMTQLLKVLATHRLMHISFEEFEQITSAACDVFTTWDDEYDKLQGLLRDIIKKNRDEHLRMVWHIDLVHKKLHQRTEQVRKFRRHHEQLRSIVASVKKTLDTSTTEQVNLAYKLVKEVDALDISKEGTDAWYAANQRYENCIDRVEALIAVKLRDQLGTAKNANEMFRIFSRFNALFVRPPIRCAIREYQTQLIQRVIDDIEALHEKFKGQYVASKACKMSGVRDIPPVVGYIIWAKQIERRLNVHMRRLEEILGRQWENHVDGQKLKKEANNFRAKLNTQSLFDEWVRNAQQLQLNESGRVLNEESSQTSKGSMPKLRVNFRPEIITLAKEVRHLKNLSFRIPLSIVNQAHKANQLYPFAITLIETVKSYEIVCEKVDNCPSVSLLVADLKKKVQSLLCKGTTLVWGSYKLGPYVESLAETVLSFQEEVEELLLINEQIEMEVKSLESCSYSSTVFSDILNKIQRAVDDLSLHRYSNLNEWVNKLDEQIERKLAHRLSAGIKAWTAALHDKNEDELDVILNIETPLSPVHWVGDPKIQSLVHKICKITNPLEHVNRSVEKARFNLLHQLSALEDVILKLNRIENTRYQVSLDRPQTQQYRNLLERIPDRTSVLKFAYETIDAKVKQMSEYVSE